EVPDRQDHGARAAGPVELEVSEVPVEVEVSEVPVEVGVSEPQPAPRAATSSQERLSAESLFGDESVRDDDGVGSPFPDVFDEMTSEVAEDLTDSDRLEVGLAESLEGWAPPADDVEDPEPTNVF